uniref:Dynein axonemal assembly factor 1 homolog n=1 Tax=Anopheles arabiensis TaxID=7173 RepID=A0A182IDW4_ANOAR
MVREQCEEEFGPKKMTKKTIQASCRKNKLYLTPHLNDVLYLHYSGYNAIDGLDEYVGLKCLWLECNAISNISGLDHQSQLRCLYLHNNLIKKIENLQHCKQLDTLNLSHNHIAKIENCGSDILPVLNTLNISHNYLKSIESLAELRKCDFVSVLDISHNRIEDIAIVKVLADMKGLRVLTLVGNPVVNDIPSYRKTLILECKSLTYLDSRPVFDKDRACAEAWKRGGYEEERKEHQRWKKEEQRKMRRSINATLRLRHRGDGEPELLKTSSDEEEEEKEGSAAGKGDFEELEYQSNDVAWKEMEALFNQHTKGDTHHAQKLAEERKASTNSVDYITGSDSNSDPTLVTDCDSCVRNSSRACSSRSDTSDSEDMFDKIIPKKHRKLASSMRPEVSLSDSSSSSETEDEAGSILDSKLDRQNTITEFIDEYKRFFHSVDLRDPKCVLKNRHKIVRPQTAKSQRTEPIVYEGVLKAMEQNSNGAKIEQARQERFEANERSLAKEAVLERLMKGHAEVDMNIEQQMISIGGKQHNFNEYRLEVFRQDQEKLQNLIDRVTAQKEKYNAHIDSIHDQLANIMEDYGQISEKLRKVDDMIQNIGDEVVVHQEKEGSVLEVIQELEPITIAEQIVENMTKEQLPDVVEANVKASDATIDPVDQLSSDESAVDLGELNQHVDAQVEVGPSDPKDPTTSKPIPEEFGCDPVYRKFIDIQYEIDKLTEDQIFTALSEAARELQEEELETKLVHDAIDEYWSTDLEDFRRNLNLDAHPIVQRFKRFIECQGTDTDDTDSEAHVRRLENAYHRYERRLSNHLFDEYLMLSRKASIATTTGGESSATELELVELDGGHVLRASTSRRATAWDLKETVEDPVEELEELNEEEDPALKEAGDFKHDELEDEESKPEVETLKSAEVVGMQEPLGDVQGDH